METIVTCNIKVTCNVKISYIKSQVNNKGMKNIMNTKKYVRKFSS